MNIESAVYKINLIPFTLILLYLIIYLIVINNNFKITFSTQYYSMRPTI